MFALFELEQKKESDEKIRLENERKRMATPENMEATRMRLRRPEYKEADRKRKATEEYKVANKKRKADALQTETKLKHGARLQKQRKCIKLLRKRKLKIGRYKAWCDPAADKPKIDLLNIPPMTMVCSDCNACSDVSF